MHSQLKTAKKEISELRSFFKTTNKESTQIEIPKYVSEPVQKIGNVDTTVAYLEEFEEVSSITDSSIAPHQLATKPIAAMTSNPRWSKCLEILESQKSK